VIQPLSKLSETRRKQILGYVSEHLADGETIVQGGRIRDPGSGRQGFLFLTEARCLMRWRDHPDVESIDWALVTAWGVNKSAPRGPILCIETASGARYAQLQTGSMALALGAGRVVRAFRRLAPASAATHKETDHGRIAPGAHDDEVEKEKLTPQALARRIIITVLAVAVLVGAALIIPLPGPWSFLLVIGAFALLAREYDWAEDTLDWIKDKYAKARAKVRSSRSK
jgi:hypothetical protein